MPRSHFAPAAFAFLRELAANNDREWFRDNKTRYEQDVRDPALRFVADFAPRLKKISPRFRADPRANGGSLFRIYRDVRFSKDKRPYKTHAGIHFRHEAGKDAHAPGFYLHMEPNRCFAACGMWRPATAPLRKIRESIVGNPEGWRRATGDNNFLQSFTLSGDSLTRAPRGFDPRHPLVEDLRRKDFIGVADLSEEAVVEQSFLDDFATLCASAAPFQRWLCGAVDAPF